MIRRLYNKTLHILLIIVVLVYILLEEIIWEGIAKPIYEYINQLKLLQKLEKYIKKTNRFVILIIFLFIFIQVEFLGALAVALLAKGKFILATSIYALKIPIAGATFWLFNVSKNKLMSFYWFKKSYLFMLKVIQQIKNSKTYQNIYIIKNKLKKLLKSKNSLKLRIKKIYINLKKTLSS